MKNTIPTAPTDSLTIPLEATTPLPAENNEALTERLTRLFGESAVMVEQPAEGLEKLFSLTDNLVVWLFAVALFVYYLFVLFAYGGHFGQMWKVAVGSNLGIKVADELSYLFMRAVRNSVTVGIGAWSLVAVGWLNMLDIRGVEGIDTLYLVPAAVGAALLVGLLQRGLTLGVCHLVRRGEVAEGLNILADTLMALAAIAATPFALLFVVNRGVSVEMLGWLTLTIGAVALLLFIIKSLIFFLEQKVSILLWFLYLCAVVLIPIGIVATVVVRGSVI